MATNETKYVTKEILTYYDSKIKQYIEEKVDVLQEGVAELDTRVDAIDTLSHVNEANIAANKDHIDENEAAILQLQSDDKIINKQLADVRLALETKLDKSEASSFATQEFVIQKIAEAELGGGSADLSNYYTKSEVDSMIPDVSKFVSTDDLERVQLDVEGNKSKLQSVEAEIVTINSKIDTIPTRVSQLENDAGYLTEHQDISHLATKEYVQDEIKNIPEVDLSSYATKDQLDYVASSIPSVEGLVTEQQLQDAIDSIEFPTTDLSNYATIEYVQSQLTNISSEYVTNEYIEQNYTTTKDLETLYVTNDRVVEVVTEQVDKVVVEEIETQVRQVIQEKVDSGEIEVKASSITYGSFDYLGGYHNVI